MRLHFVGFVALGLLLLVASPTAARKWMDSSGKFSVEAELVEVKDEQVVLKKTTGKVITLPVARLSETDRQYLQSLAQEQTNEPPRPAPEVAPEVIAAWEKAGASFSLVAEDVPFFIFSRFPLEKFSELPPPEVPFGLKLGGYTTDAVLKELAGLTQLQSLNLSWTKVTDAGLKELAGLAELQTLNLQYTKVTDAGVQELLKASPNVRITGVQATRPQLNDTGQTQLQTPDLRGTKETDRQSLQSLPQEPTSEPLQPAPSQPTPNQERQEAAPAASGQEPQAAVVASAPKVEDLSIEGVSTGGGVLAFVVKLIAGLGNVVCFALVVAHLFRTEQTGLGVTCIVLMFFCGIGGLIAFVKGWMEGLGTIMWVWTGCIALSIFTN